MSHALGATAISLPWPLLLADVWSATGSDAWLGLAGATRLLPYVLLSTAAGIVADRVLRSTVLGWSAATRNLLVAGAGAALLADQLVVAVVVAALAVAVSTPAYPASAAALPGIAGSRTGWLTDLLVTVGVSAFVVGPAVGGVLLGLGVGHAALPASAVLAVRSWVLLRGLRCAPRDPTGSTRGRLAVVLATPGVPAAIGVVTLHNFVESAAGVALLGLSHQFCLSDAIMVLAAMLGALVAPWLAGLLGPVALFVTLALVLALASLGWALAVSHRRAVGLPVVEDHPTDVNAVHHQ